MFRKERFIYKANDVQVIPPLQTQRNLDGKDAEKNGDIEAAIRLYEENVRERFTGSHPYNRLAIIYHKQKRYEDEKRVLRTAIDVFSTINNGRKDVDPKLEKFKERLAKLEG